MATFDEGKLLKSALETVSDPLLLWTPDGRVAFASRRFLELYGLDREEVEGAGEAQLNDALDRHGLAPLPPTADVVHAAAGGRRIERTTRVLDDGARLDLFHDASGDQQNLQRQEELLGVATHDLRSPLANVRSYAGLLLGGRMQANLDPRVKRSAEVIARNADRALRLLQAYFDTLRAETGYLDIDRQPQPLLPVLDEGFESRRAAAAEKGIEMEALLPESLPPVAIDRDRILGAVQAFLDNAIARESAEGLIRMRCELRPSEVFICFEDHGARLDDEQARQVFDRDTQILREKRLGLGFSLAVARAVAAAHGGSVGVQSTSEWTAFYLSLPRPA